MIGDTVDDNNNVGKCNNNIGKRYSNVGTAELENLYSRLFPESKSIKSVGRNFEPKKLYGVSGADSREMALRFLACFLSGACPIPLAATHPYVKSFGLEFLWPDDAIVVPDLASYACLTSGSIGSPKVIFFSTKGALANAEMHARALQIDSTSVIYQSLPLNHSFGIIAYVFCPALTGCTIVFQKAPFDWLSIGEKKAVLHLTPDHLQRVLKMTTNWPLDLTLSIGASKPSPLAMSEMTKKVKNLFITYGLTEAGPRVSSGRWQYDSVEGYIGQVFPDIKIKIDFPQNNVTSGELLINTPSLAVGISAERITADGFFRTGDRVSQNNQGDLVFIERLDQSFKWRGRLYEISSLKQAARHAGITSDSGLFVPLNSSEEFVVVTAQPQDEVLWHEIFQLFGLPHPKVEVLKELPRNCMGKIIGEPMRQSESGRFYLIFPS